MEQKPSLFSYQTDLRINEATGNSIECLLRPWEEPIYGGTVNDAGEVATSSAQIISHWTHAEGHVETGGAVTGKPLPHRLLRDVGRNAPNRSQRRFRLGPNIVYHTIFVLF